MYNKILGIIILLIGIFILLGIIFSFFYLEYPLKKVLFMSFFQLLIAIFIIILGMKILKKPIRLSKVIKAILLFMILIIVGGIITFILNSNFRNLVINVGASKSINELRVQFGKKVPPVININRSIKEYDEKENIIINNYILTVINSNKEQENNYKIEIMNDNLYTHSIDNPFFVEYGKIKKISFNIQTHKINQESNQKIKQITIRVTDIRNPELFAEKKLVFIFNKK